MPLIDAAAPAAGVDLLDRPDDSLDGISVLPSEEEKTVAKAARFTKVQASVRILGLALVWACMVFWVQDLTTAPTLWKTPDYTTKDLTFRFLLNFSLATAVLSFLSARWVGVLAIINLWASTAVLSYFVNYQRALSWLTISNQAGEGGAVAAVALEDAAPYLAVLIPLSFAIVFFFYRWRPRLGRQTKIGGAALAVYAMTFAGLDLDHKPLKYLEKFETADGVAHGYGYAITWAAESYYVDYDGIRDNAMKRLAQPTERLLEHVAPVTIGDRLAVIQVESLDDAVINFDIEGREVTPRLNEWANAGSYLRVQAPKRNGSCDSDFALLFGALPSTRMAPYRVPEFPFERSITNTLHDRGYNTSIYHNVSGNFFERRTAFGHMNFDRSTFREEMLERIDIEDPQWTLEDRVMLEMATNERENPDKFFEFLITGTSHTPYLFSLGDHERTFFPKPNTRTEAYFDTINYVDKYIGEYVDNLPDNTVVVIYGDHWSRGRHKGVGYASLKRRGFGIVPALLFRKTADGVEPLFEIDGRVSHSANLRLVDMTAWLRESLGVAPAYEGLVDIEQQTASL